MPRVDVLRTYLELSDLESLRTAACPDPRARVEQVHGCPPSFFRYLYVEVGRRYQWTDRLVWDDPEMAARLADPDVSLHLLSVAGAPAGYFELEKEDDGSVQIAFFGLLPEFHGRGLGKYLLTEAARGGLRPGGLAGLAAHLHPRRPCRPAQLRSPRLPEDPPGDVPGRRAGLT